MNLQTFYNYLQTNSPGFQSLSNLPISRAEPFVVPCLATFDSVEHAIAAKEDFDKFEVNPFKDSVLSVQYYHQGLASEPTSSLYISSLDPRITHADLAKVFEGYGSKSCIVAKIPKLFETLTLDTPLTTWALVEFETPKQAIAAKEENNKRKLGNFEIHIDFGYPKNTENGTIVQPVTNIIHVSGMVGATVEQMTAAFSGFDGFVYAFNEGVSAFRPRAMAKRAASYDGAVMFKTVEQAKAVVKQIREDAELRGKELYIGIGETPVQLSLSRNVLKAHRWRYSTKEKREERLRLADYRIEGAHSYEASTSSPNEVTGADTAVESQRPE